MVEARVRRLPGYVERVELTRQKGPAYRLRQYASRVLGDMQLPDEVLRTARLWALSLDLKDYSVVMLLRHTNAIMAASPQLPDEVLKTVGKKRQDYIFWCQLNESPSVIPGCPGLGSARLWALSLGVKDVSVLLLRHTKAIMAASPQFPDEVLRIVGKKRQDHICLRQCNGNLSITPGSPGLRTASLRAHTLDMKH